MVNLSKRVFCCMKRDRGTARGRYHRAAWVAPKSIKEKSLYEASIQSRCNFSQPLWVYIRRKRWTGKKPCRWSERKTVKAWLCRERRAIQSPPYACSTTKKTSKANRKVFASQMFSSCQGGERSEALDRLSLMSFLSKSFLSRASFCLCRLADVWKCSAAEKSRVVLWTREKIKKTSD